MNHLTNSLKTALARAEQSPPIIVVAFRGLRDGTIIVSTMLGMILAVGTLAMIALEQSRILQVIVKPLEPVLSLMGIQESSQVAPAAVVGIAEVYLPALIVKGKLKHESSRFFVAVLSISQLIYFSSLAPMILQLFHDVPAKLSHLVYLFFLRTIILIPLLSIVNQLFLMLGLLQN